MKIITEQCCDQIHISDIDEGEFIVAGINQGQGQGQIVLAIPQGRYGDVGNYNAQIITARNISRSLMGTAQHGMKVMKAGMSVRSLIKGNSQIEWHAFSTAHDFFVWAAEVTA